LSWPLVTQDFTQDFGLFVVVAHELPPLRSICRNRHGSNLSINPDGYAAGYFGAL